MAGDTTDAAEVAPAYGGGRPGSVFLSYARKDGQAFAELVRARLTGLGYDVWQDVVEHGRRPGLVAADRRPHPACQRCRVRDDWRGAGVAGGAPGVDPCPAGRYPVSSGHE